MTGPAMNELRSTAFTPANGASLVADRSGPRLGGPCASFDLGLNLVGVLGQAWGRLQFDSVAPVDPHRLRRGSHCPQIGVLHGGRKSVGSRQRGRHEFLTGLRRLTRHVVRIEDLQPLVERACGEHALEDRRDLRQRLKVEQAPRRVGETLVSQQVFPADGSQHRHIEGQRAAGHEHPPVIGCREQPVHGQPTSRAERARAVAVEAGHLWHLEVADLHGARAGHFRHGVGGRCPACLPGIQPRCRGHSAQHSGPVGRQRYHELDWPFGVADLVPADAGHGGDLRRGARTGCIRPDIAPSRTGDDHRAPSQVPCRCRSVGVGHEDRIGAAEQLAEQRRGERCSRWSQDAGQ